MWVYRIKQFFQYIFSLIKKEDFSMMNNYLNEYEVGLFMNISKSERQHSIRVCKSALLHIDEVNVAGIDKEKMAKCALLHDIGKYKAKLNIFEKSIIIILNSITHERFLKYNKNKRIHDYYNHPYIGLSLLKDHGELDEDILICISDHHKQTNINKNIYLKILVMYDNNN